LRPDFVVHLGDVQHPLPGMPGYGAAVGAAKEILGRLGCPLHIVPGNHGVGDKPAAWAGAPQVAPALLEAFEAHWGTTWKSFDHGGGHFVLLNAQVLNSGLPAEKAQRRWLHRDLSAARKAGRRIFVFSHYPVYLARPNEPAHYDNLAEPARSWLLDLLRRFGVEAVFAGHAHHFFYDRRAGTDLYVVPSPTFVRADFSEMFPVEPAAEFGRNDEPKMGFMLVRATEDGHAVEFIRTHGATDDTDLGETSPPLWLVADAVRRAAPPVGVYLRHTWALPGELPYAGLDEFGRKPVRNDYPLLALWGAGLRKVRVPLGDLLCDASRERMATLAARGIQFTVFSVGTPDDPVIDVLARHPGLVHTWEILLPWDRLGEATRAGRRLKVAAGLRVALSKTETLAEHRARSLPGPFSHFVRHGFRLDDDPLVAEALAGDTAGAVDDVVFRVGPETPAGEAVKRAAAMARRRTRRAVVHMALHAERHAAINADDQAVAERVAESVSATFDLGGADVFFDTFVDCDRGYYPRHGLVDRRGNPRQAWYALRQIVAAHR
jgi:hypothetical protein